MRQRQILEMKEICTLAENLRLMVLLDLKAPPRVPPTETLLKNRQNILFRHSQRDSFWIGAELAKRGLNCKAFLFRKSVGAYPDSVSRDAANVKQARSLSQWQLAELAGIGLATLKRIEAAPEIRGAADTFWKLQTALEKAGVEFIPEDDHKGPGVRLKERARTKPKRGRSRVG